MINSTATRRLLTCGIVLPLVIAACASRGETIASRPGAGVVAQSTVERELVEAAGAIVRSAPAISEDVWPGYWPDDQPFILYDVEEDLVLLVADGTRPSGFLPFRDQDLPSELQGRLYLHRGILPGLEAGFHVDYRVGDVAATAVQWRGDIESTLATLFHEEFHGYQSREFVSISTDYYVEPSVIAAPEYRAMAEVERRMLLSALKQPAGRLPELLRHYLAVRWVRAHSVPDSVRVKEQQTERAEGSANLVGYAAAALATDKPNLPEENVRLQLERPIKEYPGGLPEQLLRWRLYGTGAAIGIVLDRLGESGWRERLQEGATFDELLARAVDFRPSEAPSIAPQALMTYEFEEVMADIATSAPTSEDVQSEADFFALTPAVLTIDFPVSVENGSSDMDMNMDMAGGFTQLEKDLLYVPTPDVVTLQFPYASLVLREHPVLLDLRNSGDLGELRIRVSAALQAIPAAGSDRAIPQGTSRFEQLTIQANGVELQVDRPVRVERENETVTVYVERQND